MPLRSSFSKLIVIGFMVMIGFSLARAIYYNSFMGIILSLVSFAAGIYFLMTVVKVKQDETAEENA